MKGTELSLDELLTLLEGLEVNSPNIGCVTYAAEVMNVLGKYVDNPQIVQMVINGVPIPHFYFRSE